MAAAIGFALMALGPASGRCQDGIVLRAPYLGYEVGIEPVVTDVADFDGDGHLDLLVANQGLYSCLDSTAFTVLFGTGTLPVAFTRGPRISTARYATWAAAGDVNGDGRVDLLAEVDFLGDYPFLAVYPGMGDGTFGSPLVTELARYLRRFTLRDLNGDARLDLIGDAYPGGMAVFLGNGDGTFGPRSDYVQTVGGSPTGLAIDDVDGDGVLDGIVTGRNGAVIVYLGHGDGTFASGAVYGAGAQLQDVAVADFDRDGRPDIAVLDASPPSIIVLAGTGGGEFASEDSIPLSGSVYCIATADFDEDGVDDLAAAGSSSILVLEGRGDGTFASGDTLPFNNLCGRVVARDLDGDGHVDLAAARQTGDESTTHPGEVHFYPGHGDGTFGDDVPKLQGILYSLRLLPGDSNADGLTDLVMTSPYNDTTMVFLGQADGTFGEPLTLLDTHRPQNAAFVDVNHDGRDDLVIKAANTLAVRLAGKSGVFGAPAYSDAPSYTTLTVGRIDDDAQVDILEILPPSWTHVDIRRQFGVGDGTFGEPSLLGFDEWLFEAALGDVNDDGHPDIVYASNPLRVSIGLGGGAFGYPLPIGGNAAGPVLLADLDGDGELDIVTIGYGPGPLGSRPLLQTLRGNGDGTFQPVEARTVPSGGPTMASFYGLFLVADFDLDGQLDVAIGSEGFVAIYQGLGGCRLGPRRDFGVEGAATLAAGDFDHDGRSDLAVVSYSTGTVSLLKSASSITADVPRRSGTAPDLALRVSPNPATSAVRVEFRSADSEPVDVKVLDIAGRCVWHRAKRFTGTESRTLSWDGRSAGGARVASGVYFVRVSARAGSQTRRVVWVSG